MTLSKGTEMKKMSFVLLLFFAFSLPAQDEKTIVTPTSETESASIYGKVKIIEKTETSSTDLSSPAHTVVYFTGFESAAKPEPIIIGQKNKSFDPTVVPVVKGQEVTFVNGERVVHNVFSMSQAKQFDLGEVKKDGVSKIVFDKTGIVDLYCNIHPNMVGTVLVLPNDRYAKPKETGDYEITGIKPGTYNVFVWHRRAAPQKKSITLKSAERLEVNWEVPLITKIAPHLNKEGKEYKVNPDNAESYK